MELNWNKVAARFDNIIRTGRYFTPEEQARYDEMQTREWQFRQNLNAYNDIKHDYPDDIVLFQVGDFFEMYGEDAKVAARELNISLHSRAVLGVGRVEMCGVPANRLEEFVEKLRESHSVTISPLNNVINEHTAYSMPVIAKDEEVPTEPVNAAETGANAPAADIESEPTKPTIREQFEQYKPVVIAVISEDTAYRNACANSDRENAVIEGNAAIRRAVLDSGDMELIRLYSDVSAFRNRLHQEAVDETYPKLHEQLRPISQEDIDDALRSWNGDIASKRAVVRYMENHARDKDTAAWLSREYGGSENKSLFITRSGSLDSVELSWAKVQRRIAQLIKAEKFYTPEEYDRLDDIDGIAIRERLAERGIVNGVVVDPEALDRDPFIQRVMSDVEQIAAQEKNMSAPDRYSIRLHPNEGGITGIWDAALDRFYEEGNQVLRFAEQDNAIQYLADIQRTHGMELTDPIFTSPTGKPYRVGDGISSLETEHKETTIVIDRVDEDDVWYTLPSVPEQDAVSIDRTVFERYLDTGYFAVVEQVEPVKELEETKAQPGVPFEVGDKVYLDGTAFEITNIGLFDVQLQDPTLSYPIFRSESKERLMQQLHQDERNQFIFDREEPKVTHTTETVAFYPAEENNLP